MENITVAEKILEVIGFPKEGVANVVFQGKRYPEMLAKVEAILYPDQAPKPVEAPVVPEATVVEATPLES